MLAGLVRASLELPWYRGRSAGTWYFISVYVLYHPARRMIHGIIYSNDQGGERRLETAALVLVLGTMGLRSMRGHF